MFVISVKYFLQVALLPPFPQQQAYILVAFTLVKVVALGRKCQNVSFLQAASGWCNCL